MQLTLGKAPKIKGKIKQVAEDFIVDEVFDFKSSNGKYIHFLLTKRGYDTFKALAALAKEFSLKQENLQIAGTKDKSALTTQRVSSSNLTKNKIDSFKHPRLKLKFLGYGEKLFLGDLRGNNFVITVRNIKYNKEQVEKIIEKNLNNLNGHFPNFFGEQRFGGVRPITHLIGKRLLKRNFKEAVLDYICLTFRNEPLGVRKARKKARTSLKDALNLFSSGYYYERVMLQHLVENNEDYVGAFKKLPPNLKRMFIHAYQAYLFNQVLSILLRKRVINYKMSIPIFTGRMKLPQNKEIFLAMKEVFRDEKLNLSDFRFKDFGELDSSNVKRAAFQKFSNFKILSIGKDELNKGKNKVVVAFFLPKGSYATVFLKELFSH